MADITPVTREEFYLAKAGEQDVPVPSAVTREEYYLEKLSNDSVVVSSPVTRREKFLYFACGGDVTLPSEDRMTRLERFIAKAGGMDVATPTAVTRLEKLWANVEGGGWKTITGVLPLTFTAKGGTAGDWTISGNDDNGTENLFDKDATDTNNGYVSPGRLRANGTIDTSSVSIAVWVSEYIAVKPNTVYTMCDKITTSAFGLCFYDLTKTYISGQVYGTPNHGNLTVTTPNDCAYIRLTAGEGYQIMLVKGSTAPDHYIPYQQGVGEQRVDGYYVSLTISQAGQPDKTVDIYIGDSPLTEGETVSKTSTGVDIELFNGENTVSTTLYNKPAMKIKYK